MDRLGECVLWGSDRLPLGLHTFRTPQELASVFACLHLGLRSFRTWKELVRFARERKEMLRAALCVITEADEVDSRPSGGAGRRLSIALGNADCPCVQEGGGAGR